MYTCFIHDEGPKESSKFWRGERFGKAYLFPRFLMIYHSMSSNGTEIQNPISIFYEFSAALLQFCRQHLSACHYTKKYKLFLVSICLVPF